MTKDLALRVQKNLNEKELNYLHTEEFVDKVAEIFYNNLIERKELFES